LLYDAITIECFMFSFPMIILSCIGTIDECRRRVREEEYLDFICYLEEY
jgi:hypothetical protein